MRPSLFVSFTAIALMAGATAHARDHMDHQSHMAAKAGDSRQTVDFPPEMREHTLSNMRDHLQALSEILTAMSDAQYAKAARIARARLGMDSPSADGCKSEGMAATSQMSRPSSMQHQMSRFMPEGMRKAGLEMHQSASAFAAEAEKADRTGSAKAALATLAEVTRQCTACHAAYRIQ